MSPAARRSLTAVVVVVLAVSALALRRADSVAFMPRCPLRAVTGWQCPGCGATRAVHALLNFRVRRALSFNPLLVISLPGLAFLAVEDWRRLRRRVPAEAPGPAARRRPLVLSPRLAWGLAVVLPLYGILRNIPAYPFTLLAS